MAKGSKLQRAIEYFREANADEARVAFQLVKEVMDERLKDRVAKTPVKRRRRTKAELEAAHGNHGKPVSEGAENGGPTAKAAD